EKARKPLVQRIGGPLQFFANLFLNMRRNGEILNEFCELGGQAVGHLRGLQSAREDLQRFFLKDDLIWSFAVPKLRAGKLKRCVLEVFGGKLVGLEEAQFFAAVLGEALEDFIDTCVT